MLYTCHRVTEVVVVGMVFGGDGEQLNQQSVILVDSLDLYVHIT